MFLWLDDEPSRDPGENWVIVRTADQAIDKLIAGGVEMVSLDHDLGDVRQDPYPREITGVAVVKWMIDNGVFPKVINVHSRNPVGGKRMVEDLNKFAPKEVVVKWWLFDINVAKDLEEDFLARGEP